MHSKVKVIVSIIAFVTVVKSHDVIVGQNTEGKKIFDENRQANPAIWRQTQNVTVNTTDNEVISRIVVTDLRPEKDGDVKVVDGGEGQKNVTLELKSPTVLRGYDFHIEVYAVPDKNQPKTEKDSTQVPSHPSQTRVQRNPDEDKNGQSNFDQSRSDLNGTKLAASIIDKNVPAPASVSTDSQGRQTRGAQSSELSQTNVDDKTKFTETSTSKDIPAPILISAGKDHSRPARDIDNNEDNVTPKIITNRPRFNIPTGVESTETTTNKQQIRNTRDNFEQPPSNINVNKNPSESSTRKNVPASFSVSEDSKTRQRRDLDNIPERRTNVGTTKSPNSSTNKNIGSPILISANKPNENSRPARDTEKNEDNVTPRVVTNGSRGNLPFAVGNTGATTNNVPVKNVHNSDTDATDKPSVSPSSYRTEKYATIHVSGKNLRIEEPTRNTRDTQNEDKIEKLNQRGKVAVNDNDSSFVPLNFGRSNENITNSGGSVDTSRTVRDTQNEEENVNKPKGNVGNNDNEQSPSNVGKNLENNTYTPVRIYERTARDTEHDHDDTYTDHNKHPTFAVREFGKKIEKTNSSSDVVRSVRDALNEDKIPTEPVQSKNIENVTNYPVTLNNDKIRKTRNAQGTIEEYNSPKTLIDNNGQRINPPQFTNKNVENITNDNQFNRNPRDTQNADPIVPSVLRTGQDRTSVNSPSTTPRNSVSTEGTRNSRNAQNEEPNVPHVVLTGQNKASVNNPSTTPRNSASTSTNVPRISRDTQNEEQIVPRGLSKEQSKTSVNNPSTTPINSAPTNVPRHARETQNEEQNVPRALPEEHIQNSPSTTPKNRATTNVPRNVRDTQNKDPNAPQVLPVGQRGFSVNSPSTTPRNEASTNVPRIARDTQNKQPNVPRELPAGQTKTSINTPSTTPRNRAATNVPKRTRDTKSEEPNVPRNLPVEQSRSSLNRESTTSTNRATTNAPRIARNTQNQEPNVHRGLPVEQSRTSINTPSTTSRYSASANVPRHQRDTQNEEQNVPRARSGEQSRYSVNSPSTTPRNRGSTDVPRNVRDTQNQEPNVPEIPPNSNRASLNNPSTTPRNKVSTNVPRNTRDTEKVPNAPQILSAEQNGNIPSTTPKNAATDSPRHVRNAQDEPELPPPISGQGPESPEPRIPFSFQFQTYPFSISFSPSTEPSSTKTTTTTSTTTTAKSRRRRDTSDLEKSQKDNKNGQWNPKISATQNITREHFDRKPVISIQ